MASEVGTSSGSLFLFQASDFLCTPWMSNLAPEYIVSESGLVPMRVRCEYEVCLPRICGFSKPVKVFPLATKVDPAFEAPLGSPQPRHSGIRTLMAPFCDAVRQGIVQK